MSWNHTSTPALRRRSSILALSSQNLTENEHPPNLRKTNSTPVLSNEYASPYTPSMAPKFQFLDNTPQSSPASVFSDSTFTSTASPRTPKKIRRLYDKVYRTGEPLPGKPLIDFEEKVWDLDNEYREANEKMYRRSIGKYDETPSTSGFKSRIQTDIF